MTPTVLTVAGSDSGGGAGIQADLKTFAALGAHGASAITALTAQNTREVRGVHVVPPDFVVAQIEAVADDLPVRAVKTGMLAAPEVVLAVAEVLGRRALAAVVVDPVLVSRGGDRLLAPEAEAALRERLLPLAAVATPNVHEVGVLLGRDAPRSEAELADGAAVLRYRCGRPVLAKGGGLRGAESVDVLDDGEGPPLVLRAPRVATRNTHGTGCTLASALAVFLARGEPLREAALRAKRYVEGAIRAADALAVGGGGTGPVDPLHALLLRTGV